MANKKHNDLEREYKFAEDITIDNIYPYFTYKNIILDLNKGIFFIINKNETNDLLQYIKNLKSDEYITNHIKVLNKDKYMVKRLAIAKFNQHKELDIFKKLYKF